MTPDEISADVLIGYRGWTADVATGTLNSTTFQGFSWPAGERMHASCVAMDDVVAGIRGCGGTAPGCTDCLCGLHAYNSPDPIARWLNDAWPQYDLTPPRRVRVGGEVSLWGLVQRTTRGYRAQYAYPGALRVAPVARTGLPGTLRAQLVAKLRRRYGVEVT